MTGKTEKKDADRAAGDGAGRSTQLYAAGENPEPELMTDIRRTILVQSPRGTDNRLADSGTDHPGYLLDVCL